MDSITPDILEKAFVAVEDWYRAVLFDNNGKVIVKKNADKLDEKELA